MARLWRVLGGALTVVGVLSLGGATGLSGPFVKDATQFVGAVPSSGATGVVVEDEIGTSAVSVSEVNAADGLGAEAGIGGTTLSLADDLGIPATVLDAYKKAAKSASATDPSCGIRWQILAGIGKVESNHAAGGRLNAAGAAVPAILGPVLNGGGFASISDHDGGRWDGDSTWDRAVGPMQFIPATWKAFGVDGSGDGVPDPNNVYDATLAAANYLCDGAGDLSTDSGLTNALLRYNHSMAYVATVTAWIEVYDEGLVVSDDLGPIANVPVPTGERGNQDSGDDKSTDQKNDDEKNSKSTKDPEQTEDPEPTQKPEPTEKPTDSPDPPEPDPDNAAPSQVKNLTATATGSTSIDLAWDAATDDVGVAGYEIKNGDGSLTEVAGDSTSATIGELAPGTAYEFQVRAVDAAGNVGAFSAIVSATTTDNAAPSQVKNFTATATGSTSIDLAWDAATDDVGVAGYEIKNGDGSLTEVAGDSTSATIGDLAPGTAYEFQVRAVDAAGNVGAFSAIASAITTDNAAPSQVKNLTATATGSTSIDLAWDAATDDVGVAGYEIKYGDGSLTEVAGDSTSATIGELAPGTAYEFQVRAVDAAGNVGAFSAIASATTGSDTGGTEDPNTSQTTRVTSPWRKR